MQETTRNKVLKNIDALKDEIIEISKTIHNHPEPGYQEFKATECLTEHLTRHGFTVEFPIKEMKTAFRAFLKGRPEKPVIGIISEYDSLPKIGHGCGHNLIAASGFGVVASLAPLLKETGGSIYLFGTPAEETDGGKIPMIDHGLFRDMDAVMMTHPESSFLVNSRALAIEAMEIQFFGKATHASATPHLGINALDAMIMFFNSINALRQQVKPDVRIHGIITRGGTAPNIIPDFAEARFYIRAQDREYLSEVVDRVKNCANGAAMSTGCTWKAHSFERTMDPIQNNPVLSELIHKNLSLLGVKEIAEKEKFPGSTDFGNVSGVVPSIYFYFPVAPLKTELHTTDFARASVSQFAHENMLLSIKAMALTAVDLIMNKNLLQDVKRTFSGAR